MEQFGTLLLSHQEGESGVPGSNPIPLGIPRGNNMNNTNDELNNEKPMSREEFVNLIMQVDDATLELIEHLLSDSALLP